MTKIHSAAFALVLSLTAVLGAEQLPSDLQRCQIDDGVCIGNSIEYFLGTFAQGISNLGVSVFDPLFIPKIEIEAKATGPFRLTTTYSDVSAHGLSQIKVKSVNPVNTPNEYKLNIKLSAPYLKFEGNSKGSGIVFDTLALDGEGPFYIILLNSDLDLTFDFVKTADGFLKISSVNLELTAPDIDVNFENMIEANPFLSSSALETLKGGIQDVFGVVKGDYEAALAEVIKQLCNNVFDNVSIADLFIE